MCTSTSDDCIVLESSAEFNVSSFAFVTVRAAVLLYMPPVYSSVRVVHVHHSHRVAIYIYVYNYFT